MVVIWILPADLVFVCTATAHRSSALPLCLLRCCLGVGRLDLVGVVYTCRHVPCGDKTLFNHTIVGR